MFTIPRRRIGRWCGSFIKTRGGLAELPHFYQALGITQGNRNIKLQFADRHFHLQLKNITQVFLGIIIVKLISQG